MQDVQRVIYERDHTLVMEFHERGKKDLEDVQMFELMRRWFENKWNLPFIAIDIKKERQR